MTPAFLGIHDPTVIAAVVGAVAGGFAALMAMLTAGPLRLWVDGRLQLKKARTDYEFEQRKKLREEVGGFRGRLLEAATSLNYRLDNLRENRCEIVGADCSETWLAVGGDYSSPSTERYYFRSTIYRFMALTAIANRFERAAIYVDPRFSEREDELIVLYVRALRWALTDPKLFDDLEPRYKSSDPTAHFFTDDLRRMCATLTRDDDELLDLHDVERILAGNHELDPVLRFFDGLQPGSLKWDRLMVFNLLLKGFINAIGYKTNKSEQPWFEGVAETIAKPQIARNLQEWLPRLGLDQDLGAKSISLALNQRLTHPLLPPSTDKHTIDDGTEPQV
ncbi:MAG TPA: hypothetical protein VGL78_12705 [Solirubrobacteraceae bacterium]|jgi:hypothetical protein